MDGSRPGIGLLDENVSSTAYDGSEIFCPAFPATLVIDLWVFHPHLLFPSMEPRGLQQNVTSCFSSFGQGGLGPHGHLDLFPVPAEVPGPTGKQKILRMFFSK